MSDSLNPNGIPLEALREIRRSWVENIERQRAELARLEHAIRMLERPHTPSIFTGSDAETLLTSGGSIRGLGGWIIKALERFGHVMTASDLCDAMYSYSWPVPQHQFKRRIAVTASAIHNDKNEANRTIVASGTVRGSREVYWALSSWMHKGELMLNRYPVSQEGSFLLARERDSGPDAKEAPQGASNDAGMEDEAG